MRSWGRFSFHFTKRESALYSGNIVTDDGEYVLALNMSEIWNRMQGFVIYMTKELHVWPSFVI